MGPQVQARARWRRCWRENTTTPTLKRAPCIARWRSRRLSDGVSLDDEKKLAALAEQSRIELVPNPDGNRVLLDGKDVTERLRSQEVTDAASKVSVHPAVREWMVAAQRKMGAGGGIVMEGRDIGTKVFPDAEVKIFLDAAPEIRGTRRFQQSPAAAAHEASVVAELQARDQRDRTRANSPLVPAADAVLIDSTYLTLDQVLARAVEVIDARLEKPKLTDHADTDMPASSIWKQSNLTYCLRI